MNRASSKKGKAARKKYQASPCYVSELLTSLFEHERIETTEAKAKELRGLTDKIISLGKEGTLHARRRALTVLRSKEMVSKLFKDVAGRFQDRKGGYTRTIKQGDGQGMLQKWLPLN